MAARADGPIVCVSYLARAELWSVPLFPAANHGVEVRTTGQSIAADGPMAAAVLAALDVPTTLVANDIGDDQEGRKYLAAASQCRYDRHVRSRSRHAVDRGDR
ncbi:hypothetical protein [Nocardia sp. CA-120079]|uniref:hypothetical protein n=1 Tax=Nocardia sp. CA-120079 TaxID=3239974 RepID=UPI003D993B38